MAKVPPPDALDRWLASHPTPTAGGGSPGPGNNPPGGPGTGGLPQLADPPKIGEPPTPPGDTPPDTPPDTSGNETNTYDPSIDYSKLFDFFGVPDDIKSKIQAFIAQSKGDVGQATPLILAYIRGTDWYAKTYSGIQYGVAAGLFGSNPESDYRQYVNSANQYYQQYLNRAVSTDEIVNSLKEGVDTSVLGKRLQGQSFANANSQDWQYSLGAFGEGQTDATGITALGRESVGLNSGLGDKLQAQLDKAHQRLTTIFQGTLASPNLSRNSQGRLTEGNVPSDIGA